MLHVQQWKAAANARITEMYNAGKRGKKCRICIVLDFNHEIERYLDSLDCNQAIDTPIQTLNRMIAEATPSADYRPMPRIIIEEIRGIEAPQPKLIARGNGWSASADESGVCVNDEIDRNNEPCAITSHAQTGNAAYRAAKRVWAQLTHATTFHHAVQILSSGGCRMHSYCRMD